MSWSCPPPPPSSSNYPHPRPGATSQALGRRAWQEPISFLNPQGVAALQTHDGFIEKLCSDSDPRIRLPKKLRYRTRARKYWPGNAGLMALVHENVEPLT